MIVFPSPPDGKQCNQVLGPIADQSRSRSTCASHRGGLDGLREQDGTSFHRVLVCGI